MNIDVAGRVSSIVTKHPGKVLLFVTLITALAGWRASKLTINPDQIDLLPKDLPSVVATQEMVKLMGGVNYLTIPLKSKDLDLAKKVSDEFCPMVEALESIRYCQNKQPVQFLKDRLPLFVDTPDLKEGAKRIRKKIRTTLAKSNPFGVELREVKDEPLVLEDLVDKYRRVDKKDVTDPYNVDLKGEMLMLIIKPYHPATNLKKTQVLLKELAGVVEKFNQSNTSGAKLIEQYEGFPSAKNEVSFGYTGRYKQNLDDSKSIADALAPVSVIAFAGILLYLFITLRSIPQLLIIMSTLVMSVLWAFAFCELLIGELNTITALLGAILMGLGIDYGIHFTFRLREEMTVEPDLEKAVTETIKHSGAASWGCSTTTAAALYLLCISQFKGFFDFGLVAGTGVMIAYALKYFTIPSIYLVLDRHFPNLKAGLVNKQSSANLEALKAKPYPYAKTILSVTALVSVALLYSATQVEFEYDVRKVSATDNPSMRLGEEVNRRYGVASDPVAIYTPDLATAHELYEHLNARINAAKKAEDAGVEPEVPTMMETVIGMRTVVPYKAKQEANVKVLKKLKRQLDELDPNMVDDPRAAQYWDQVMTMLSAEPYTEADLPDYIHDKFKPVKESNKEGYLTYVYPKVRLWDGRDLVSFGREMTGIKVGDKTYQSAGMSALFSDLLQIVLKDGLLFTSLAAFVIFLITWADFRSIRGAIIAMLPLFAGLIWMLGLMALTSWKINFINIIVFPLVFGYGISAGVHLYHRYVESGSVMLAVRATGGAVAASSITTLVGWAALLVSDHRGLISMGILACFGISSALLVSLTVLPSLLQVTHRAPKDESEQGAAT